MSAFTFPGMQRYVQQLVDAFEARAKARRESWDPAPPSAADAIEEHAREVEAYLAGPTPGISQPLAYYAEVDLDELPAPEGLGDEEARALFASLNHLIHTYGHAVDDGSTPDCPGHLRYAYLLDYLRQVVPAPGPGPYRGMRHQDCGTHPPECPYGKYCGCARWWSRAEFVKAGGDDADMPDERFSDGYVEPVPTDAERLGAAGYFHEELNPQQVKPENRPHADDPDFYRAPAMADAFLDKPYIRPEDVSPDLESLQATVDHYIDTRGVRYFSELTNTAILAEEVGEVARLAARIYGEQSFKRDADAASAKTDWADELSDVLFVLTCLANQTGVNLTEAFWEGMQKRYGRDGERHLGNEKLRGRDPDLPF